VVGSCILFYATFCLDAAAGSVVLKLTAHSFDSALKTHPFLLVKFYAPYCGHSMRLAPDYEQAAVTLRGEVTFAEVDAFVEVELATKFKVDGYPIIMFFRWGKAEEFGGGRTNASIVDWLTQNTDVVLQDFVTDTELKKLISNSVGPSFVARGGSSLKANFKQIAGEHRAIGSFYFQGHEGADMVQVYQNFDSVARLEVSPDTDSQMILSFLRERAFPLFGEVREDNFNMYQTWPREGMLWACFNPKTYRKDAKEHAAIFHQVAHAFPQLHVVYIDTYEYDEYLVDEIGCDFFPTIVLVVGNISDESVEPGRYKKRMSQSQLNAGIVGQWVQDVLSGLVEDADDLEAADHMM